MTLTVPRLQDQGDWQQLIMASRRFLTGWANTAATPRAYAAYLHQAAQPSSACRIIRRRADGALLGTINLTGIIRGSFQSGYLGYYIGAPYAGQGYMTEALGLMLRLAFRQLRLHRVEANIQPANRASLRLVARAGFHQEGFSPRYLKIGGRWRDHERWTLLVEDWRSVAKPPIAKRMIGESR